jgi:hypothetical protein
MYTLADYERAKAELSHWSEASDRYSGNHPGKYQSSIRVARRQLRMIEGYLRARRAGNDRAREGEPRVGQGLSESSTQGNGGI